MRTEITPPSNHLSAYVPVPELRTPGLTFTNHINHGRTPFAEYLNAPGYSHSFFKSQVSGVAQEITPTDKMRFGTLVDGILSGTGADISATRYKEAKQVAAHLTRHMPWLKEADAQQHLSATVEFAGLSLPLRNLPDFIVPGVATVELKVSDIHSRQVEDHIARMGWPNQVFMERNCANVPVGYILVYCLRNKDIVFKPLSGGVEWMKEMVLMFGTVTTQLT